MNIVYFTSPEGFRAWLEANHATATELLVGFRKKDSGLPSMTWPESVDEALCYGWIDGIRRSVDASSYSIRFSPRKARSVWSNVNIARVAVLSAEGRMTAAGLRAYEARVENRSGIYSYEQRGEAVKSPLMAKIKSNKKACAFWEAQPPSYRKAMSWWVVSAKTDATREKRLATLIAECAAGRRIAQMVRKKSAS